MLDIEITGLDPLLFKFRVATDQTRQKIQEVLEETANKTNEIAMQLASERLKSTTRYNSMFYSIPGSLSVRFGNNFQFAKLLEAGSKPRVIKPRESKVLRFEKGGQVWYPPQVLHPGTAPYNIIGDAWKQYMPEFVRRMTEEVKV